MRTTACWIVASALCFTFIANSSSHSQTAQNLVGTISDTQSVPIPYARIVLYSEAEGTATVVRVDANGHFALNLPIGNYYDVMAAARGFAPVSKRLFVTSETNRFDPKLEADSEHSEEQH